VRSPDEILLSVHDLRKHFQRRGGIGRVSRRVYAVDGVSFQMKEGETLGLVGESGCGKSTLARLLAGLYKPTAGSVLLRGVNVRDRTKRSGDGRQIQMVFQEPAASLDPRRTISDSIAEPLLGRVARGQRAAQALEMLERVGLRSELGRRFPHQLSGGQQQRACIARALISRPSLVVLDEALSSLDVSLQAQILDLLRALQAEFESSYVFITHDLATAFELSSRIVIMYLGEIVESIPVEAFGDSTLHPYSRALVEATLTPDPVSQRRRRAVALEGDIPSAADPPSGCRFHTRCPFAQERCVRERPPFIEHRPEHWAACHFAGSLPAAPAPATGTATS
jgi:oligopeptide/dipeptide ABC transporter ATP-binding protein